MQYINSFPDRRCTSLEHSVAGRSLIQFFITHSHGSASVF